MGDSETLELEKFAMDVAETVVSSMEKNLAQSQMSSTSQQMTSHYQSHQMSEVKQTQEQTNGIYRAQPVRIVGEAQELQKTLLDQRKQMEEEERERRSKEYEAERL